MEEFENMFVHMEQPAAVRSADWAAASFGVNDLLLPALCASPITADQSPSCPSSNESSDSDVLMRGYSASMLDMEHQLQLLLEPGNGSLAPSAGYQAPTPQTVPLYSTSQFVAAPGISPFSHSGGLDMLHQHRQHQYHASTVTQHQAAHAGSAQPPAVAALTGPCNSSNTDAARSKPTLTAEEQQHLLELLLNPHHQQQMMPHPCGMQRQLFAQPCPQQQPHQHSFESSPLVLPHELQQLQQQQQLQEQMATPPCRQNQQATAQQAFAAADAAQRPSSRHQQVKQASSKPPAAKQLQQPKQAAKARVPASSEDDAADAPAPSKRRGRPPLSPGKYSRGYLAIKAYRQRKKGMVEGMEAEIAAMQEQVVLLQAEQAALQLKHHVLQAAATASDEVLSHMAALQLNPPAGAASAGTSSSTTSDGLGASSDAAAAALDSVLLPAGSSNSSSTHSGDADWTSVLKLVEYELQRTATLAQQQAQQRSNAAALGAVGRYKAYVCGTAEHLAQGLLPAHAQQQRSCSSPATNSSSSGFPAFPLGIADLLQLAQLQRSLQEPTAAAASSGRACMLDLGAGVSVEVGRDFWAKVAQQVPAPSSQQQQQRLEATWEVYSAALGRLAQDRQQLLGRLSAGAAGVDAASPAGIEGSLQLAAAVEQFASRARALTLTYEWALQGLLTDEQAAKMCVACWPYLPAVGAIVSSMLGRERAV